jgi:hypothetical protein
MIRARDSVDCGGTPGMPQNSNFWDAVRSPRTRVERPRGRRTAEERDELAPLHFLFSLRNRFCARPTCHQWAPRSTGKT